MPENPYQPPKEVNEPRRRIWTHPAIIGAVIGIAMIGAIRWAVWVLWSAP